MKPLHIVHTESSCGWGGQEIRILTEAEGMIRRGHNVTLICPAEAPISLAAKARNITVVNLPISKKSWRGLFALQHWLSQNNSGIDVLNTHSSTDSWLTALASCLTFNAPSLVRTRHVSSPVPVNWPTYWLYRHASKHVVVTGEALRQQLHRENKLPLDQMTSVPTGIDLNRYAPASRTESRQQLKQPKQPDTLTLGILATLRNWKGHRYLLAAFASLAGEFPHWRLLIVGGGPLRTKLEEEAATLQLGDRICFVGNQDNVPQWLNCMDLFCLPSYGDEGIPQSIMQAMACGLPVVSTHVGAISEAVVDEQTGLLIAPKNTQMLASALQRLMADPVLREKFAAAGLQRAQSRFGIDIMLDRMEAVFAANARNKA